MAEGRFLCGVDVSHYQGDIDWARVANAGVTFAFIKATDGVVGMDPKFGANWSAARAAGLRRGAYHFFRAEQDAEMQARHFLTFFQKGKEKEGNWGELPPVLDFEVLGAATAAQGLQGGARWMELVGDATGRKPMVYTGASFWGSKLADSALFAEHPLWIAHYTTAAEPTIPTAWKNWAFWQHSEKGLVPGIEGGVDLDYFDGALRELDALGTRITTKMTAAG